MISALPAADWGAGVVSGVAGVALGGVVAGGVADGGVVLGGVALGGVVLGGVDDGGVAGGGVAGGAFGSGVAWLTGGGDPPPAAFSNSLSWRRSSTSFSRTVGSRLTVLVPDVPTAPAVPDALAGSGIPAGPSRAVRVAETFA